MMDRHTAQSLDRWLTTPPEPDELPEICPTCGQDNCDENGEWLSKGSEPFCSMTCHVKWLAEEYRYEAEISAALDAADAHLEMDYEDREGGEW